MDVRSTRHCQKNRDWKKNTRGCDIQGCYGICTEISINQVSEERNGFHTSWSHCGSHDGQISSYKNWYDVTISASYFFSWEGSFVTKKNWASNSSLLVPCHWGRARTVLWHYSVHIRQKVYDNYKLILDESWVCRLSGRSETSLVLTGSRSQLKSE